MMKTSSAYFPQPCVDMVSVYNETEYGEGTTHWGKFHLSSYKLDSFTFLEIYSTRSSISVLCIMLIYLPYSWKMLRNANSLSRLSIIGCSPEREIVLSPFMFLYVNYRGSLASDNLLWRLYRSNGFISSMGAWKRPYRWMLQCGRPFAALSGHVYVWICCTPDLGCPLYYTNPGGVSNRHYFVWRYATQYLSLSLSANR